MNAVGLRVAGIGMATAAGGTRFSMAAVYCEADLARGLGARDPDGRLVSGFRASWLGRAGGDDRLAALARAALADDQLADGAAAIAGTAAGMDAAGVPLLLCLAAPAGGEDSGMASASASAVLASIVEHAPLPIDRRRCRAVAEGQRGLWPLLLDARELIANGHAAACLVGAVDSLVEPARLARLLQEGRIGPGAPGVIPGEAAVFLLLGPPARGPRGAGGPMIVGLGFDVEHAGAPVTGRARARAMNRALQEARVASAAQMAALTHDAQTPAAIEELALARARLALGSEAARELQIWAPFRALGETGAAAGLLSLATAAFLTQNGGAGGPTLTALAADGNERWAAAMVPARRPERDGGQNRESGEHGR